MKKIGLGLSGGGILGAYQAAILYELSKKHSFSCVSGASIGAVNACLLYGNSTEALKDFWFSLGDDMPEQMPTFFNVSSLFLTGATNFTKPRSDFWNFFFDGLYVSDCAPFVETIQKYVDFDKINSLKYPSIYISATDVKKGSEAIFTNEEINIDNLTASFSIPEVFPFKKIGDKVYWDGAFTRNPALLPMLEHKVNEIWIVRLLKQEGEVPADKDKLKLRMNEINFNTPLRLEIEFIKRLNEYAEKVHGFEKEYTPIKIKQQMLDIDTEIYSALYADKNFIKELWEKGVMHSKKFID